MVRELFMKMSEIEGGSIEAVNWQLRSEAFGLFRELRDARNMALHTLDVGRYRRLSRLSELAWERYERRSRDASCITKDPDPATLCDSYFTAILIAFLITMAF